MLDQKHKYKTNKQDKRQTYLFLYYITNITLKDCPTKYTNVVKYFYEKLCKCIQIKMWVKKRAII